MNPNLKYKIEKILIIVTVSLLILIAGFFTYGTNPILHLMYSDDYILKTSTDTEIVKTFYELYPDAVSRIVRDMGQEPAIVFEKTQDQKMAFLAVGNFEGKNLTSMYKCFSFESVTFETKFTATPKLIQENPCF